MAKDGSNFDQLRSRIKKSMEEQEAKRRIEMLRQRIDIARNGVHQYDQAHFQDAIKCFNQYLKILEDWKDVEEGKLVPSLFDPKDDYTELLLISGVYWDMAKLYDRSKNPKMITEMQKYLDKFVMFSRGMTFQPISAESVRKYLVANKPIHRTSFQNAYNQLKDGSCFIATAVSDLIYPETLFRLRNFRDFFLLKHHLGRCFVNAYYQYGSFWGSLVAKSPLILRKSVAKTLDIFGKFIFLLMK